MQEFKSPQDLREMPPQLEMSPPVVQPMVPMLPLPTLSYKYNKKISMQSLPKSSSGMLITSRFFGITARAGLGESRVHLNCWLKIAK